MKKTLLFSAIIAVSMAFSYHTLAPKGKLKFDVGTKMVYNCNFMGDTFDFNLHITDREAGGVAFNYEMTNKINTKGSAAISPDALKTANKINCYFPTGNMQLRDATTIWLSTKSYEKLSNGEVVVIDIGNANEDLKLVSKQKMEVKAGGRTKSVKVLYGVTNANHKFWILDDKKNPIILKWDIDFGWTGEIKKID